jgi:hypothetical protein
VAEVEEMGWSRGWGQGAAGWRGGWDGGVWAAAKDGSGDRGAHGPAPAPRATCQDRRPEPRQCHAAAAAPRRPTWLSHAVWARTGRDVGHGAGEHGGALVVVEAIVSGLLMVLNGRPCCTLSGCFLSNHYRLVRPVGGVLGGGTGASGCGAA